MITAQHDRPRRTPALFLLASLATFSACTGAADATADVAFWNELRSLCGRAFPGEVVHATPLDSAVLGQPLVLNVWQCWNEEVRIAVHVGDDRSRVWLLRWQNDRLHLVHSIHTATGDNADPTNYGGVVADSGTATRQTFRPDDETRLRFPSARGLVWTLELRPRERLTYQFGPVSEPDRFRLDFDLTTPVPRPPPPWGWTRTTAPTPSGR